MASRHLSIRIPNDTFARLDEESRRSGRTRSDLAKTLIEEGLRMAEHPGIVFRPGPVGRRPGLVGGPDVWELIRVLGQLSTKGDAAVAELGEQINLTPDRIHVALGYYADHQDEIDNWIERADDESKRAEEAWHRQQALLAR